MAKYKVTAILVVKNEAPRLVEYFEHVRRFCDEIIAVDQHSTDNTLNLCLENCDKVFLSKNTGYCECDWGFAASQAKNDWICNLCPDERFENRFINELDNLIDKCLLEGHDSMQCGVDEYYDGVSLNEDPKPMQCRLFRKGLKFSNRVHTNVAFKNPLPTDYIQYHFKSYVETLEKEKVREWYYEAMQKTMVGHFFDTLNLFMDMYKEHNNIFVTRMYGFINGEPQTYFPTQKDFAMKYKYSLKFKRP